MNGVPTVKVWSVAVRGLHGGLVLSVALSTLGLWWLGGLHQPAGYGALAIVLARLLWGAFGSARADQADRARFVQFVCTPRATLAYLRLLLQRREPRYIGHNPLRGWMVLALLLCVAGLGLTGWLYTTDAYWGDETVERVHRALAWGLLVLVGLHLAGVVFTSLRHHENLVRAMLTGRKRAPGAHDDPCGSVGGGGRRQSSSCVRKAATNCACTAGGTASKCDSAMA